VEAHPAELLPDQSGKTLFVFVSAANKIQVVDTNQRKVVSTWPVSSQRNDDGVFDEKTRRLFVGTRSVPPRGETLHFRCAPGAANPIDRRALAFQCAASALPSSEIHIREQL
jgi:hypothetical protein